ncbi:MAG: helix-turn-helix domain-containing protein [Pseudomonadota bacterium]
MSTSAADQSSQEEKDPQFAYTLARGLDVLRAFDASSPVLGNRELSQRTGISRPTVARLTRTLALQGYLKYNEATARYRLAASVLSFGYPLLTQLSVRQMARQQMQQLADYAKGAVSLAMRSGLNMVIVESCMDNNALTGRPDVGATRPIASTALGMAYYCAADAAEQAQIRELLQKDNAEGWLALEKQLNESQLQFAAKGYCTLTTASVGIQAIAVPVRSNFDGETLVINCAVAPFNLKSNALEQRIAPRLLNLVQGMENAQGRA